MLEGVLEGILFVVGEDGISESKIKEILNINDEELNKIINQLHEKYSKENSGLLLTKFGEKYKLTTKAEHKKYYESLAQTEDDTLLSQSSLEVLAIVAYNQPITRVSIDEIRGINSSHMVRKLVSKNLIKEAGRANTPGKPILYEVTDDFLDYFGLSTVEDLPKMEEIEIDNDEKDLYESKYKED